MSDASSIPSATPTIAAPTTDGRYCITCSYPLNGLPSDGACPECGTAVELSLREILENADRGYIRTLRSGLSLVLIGTMTQLVCASGLIISSGVLSIIKRTRVAAVDTVVQGIVLLVSIAVIVGYWKFTTPDPAKVALESTRSARSIIRSTVAAQVVLTLVSLAAALMAARAAGTSGAGRAGDFKTAVDLVTLLVWGVGFVAMMKYTRWLATRVPDFLMVKRTKDYMWLLPLTAVGGTLLFAVGFILALVLYWEMLHRLRTHLRSIEKTGKPAKLKKMVDVDE